jgi:hypothetical protein
LFGWFASSAGSAFGNFGGNISPSSIDAGLLWDTEF